VECSRAALLALIATRAIATEPDLNLPPINGSGTPCPPNN